MVNAGPFERLDHAHNATYPPGACLGLQYSSAPRALSQPRFRHLSPRWLGLSERETADDQPFNKPAGSACCSTVHWMLALLLAGVEAAEVLADDVPAAGLGSPMIGPDESIRCYDQLAFKQTLQHGSRWSSRLRRPTGHGGIRCSGSTAPAPSRAA